MTDEMVAADAVSAYLDDDERVRERLVCGGGLERDVDGAVSTHSPTGDFGTVVVVTTKRVLFVVGGGDRGGDDATVSIPYADVADVDATDGLIRTAFTVATTDGETYSCSPDEGDLQAAAGDITQRANKFERIRNLVDKAELNSSEVSLDPDLPVEDIEAATSTLARAYALVTDLEADAPHGLDALRERIETCWLHNYVERSDRLQDRASAAVDDGRYDAGVRDVEAALASYEAAVEIAEKRGFDRVDERRGRRDDLEAHLAELEAGPIADAAAAVETAQSAAGAAAAKAWLRAYEAYGSALEAARVDLPVATEDPAAAIRYQRAWVARETVDALVAIAESEMERAEDGERERDCYERAVSVLETALTVARDHDIDTEPLEARRERAENGVEMAEWEWGG